MSVEIKSIETPGLVLQRDSVGEPVHFLIGFSLERAAKPRLGLVVYSHDISCWVPLYNERTGSGVVDDTVRLGQNPEFQPEHIIKRAAREGHLVISRTQDDEVLFRLQIGESIYCGGQPLWQLQMVLQ